MNLYDVFLASELIDRSGGSGGESGALKQYRIDYLNGKLYHNNVQLTYADIKAKVQDETKFVFVYYSTLYLIPAFVNDTVGQFECEAICFANSYMIQDTAVMYRVIINEQNAVRLDNKRLIDENHVYNDDIEDWEEIPNFLETPSMKIIKDMYDKIQNTQQEIDDKMESVEQAIEVTEEGTMSADDIDDLFK